MGCEVAEFFGGDHTGQSVCVTSAKGLDLYTCDTCGAVSLVRMLCGDARLRRTSEENIVVCG
jgi:hypothetical protein